MAEKRYEYNMVYEKEVEEFDQETYPLILNIFLLTKKQ